MSFEKTFPQTYYHQLKFSPYDSKKDYLWFVPKVNEYDELIISWNADRPVKGHYVIQVSVNIGEKWSPWLLYAVWGDRFQYSFQDYANSALVRSYQDQIQLLDGNFAKGFQIRIQAYAGATLDHFYRLYACTSNLQNFKVDTTPPFHSSILLPLTGVSQLSLNHPRNKSLCSPSSTTSCLHYLLGNKNLNALIFAKKVHDSAFDIYGNWPFNTAQAFVELGFQWLCFCRRLPSFSLIQETINQGFPVVTSIKGMMTGSFLSYTTGHLVALKGYNAGSQQIICMDPAFPTTIQTCINYPWEEFINSWKNRQCLAYFFINKNHLDLSRHLLNEV